MERLFRRGLPLLIGLALIAAGVTGCGGGGSSSGSDAGGASASALKEAEGVTAAADEVPTGIGITEQVSAAPPKGKTILYLTCAASVCTDISHGVEAAADALGWNVKTLPVGAAAEEITQAWNEAVQLKPDAVIEQGYPSDSFKSQLAKLKADGIPYVAGGVNDTNPDILTVVGGAQDSVARGKLMANWVIAKTGGKADVVFPYKPAYPTLAVIEKSFEKEYKELCPSCGFKPIQATVEEVGTAEAGKIVSAVQADPDVNYIVGAAGDDLLGVPEALRAAGLQDRVEAISQAGDPSNYTYIKEGNVQVADLPFPLQLSGWYQVDALVRYFNHEPLPTKSYEVLPTYWLTEENIGDPSAEVPVVPNYQSQFEKLWKVGG